MSDMTATQARELLERMGFDVSDLDRAQAHNKEQIEKHNEKQIEAAMDYYAAFNSVSGAIVLERLKDQTIRISTMNKSMCIIDGDIPLNPAEFMAFREGQNSIIRHIQDMIVLATQKESE